MDYSNVTEILSRREAAEYLKISRGTLDKLNIPCIRIRRRVVYRIADIDAWLEAQKVEGVAI